MNIHELNIKDTFEIYDIINKNISKIYGNVKNKSSYIKSLKRVKASKLEGLQPQINNTNYEIYTFIKQKYNDIIPKELSVSQKNYSDLFTISQSDCNNYLSYCYTETINSFYTNK